MKTTRRPLIEPILNPHGLVAVTRANDTRIQRIERAPVKFNVNKPNPPKKAPTVVGKVTVSLGLLALLQGDETNNLAYFASPWTTTGDAALGSQSSRLKYVGSSTLFYSNSVLQNLSGNLYRSTDGGVTFAQTTDPSIGRHLEVDLGSGGRLWLLADDSSGSNTWTPRVYYSDDYGDSWTLSYTHGADEAPYTIAACPAANNIAFAHRNGTGTFADTPGTDDQYKVTSSLDGGATWNTYDVPTPAGVAAIFSSDSYPVYYCNLSFDRLPIVFTSTGRLIAFVPCGTGTPGNFGDIEPGTIQVSSNGGSSWTAKYTFDTFSAGDFNGGYGAPLQLVRGGGAIFALNDHTEGSGIMVLRSRDNGDTWEEIAPPEGLSQPGSSGLYVESSDKLYVMNEGNGSMYSLGAASHAGTAWTSEAEAPFGTTKARALASRSGTPN